MSQCPNELKLPMCSLKYNNIPISMSFQTVCVSLLLVQNLICKRKHMAVSCQISLPEKANMAPQWNKGIIISRGGTKQEMNEMEDEKRRCTAKKVLVEYEKQDNIFPHYIYTCERKVLSRVLNRERELNTYTNTKLFMCQKFNIAAAQ